MGTVHADNSQSGVPAGLVSRPGPLPSYRQSTNLVRPRLLSMLGARPTSPTLVVAPAGWGKTTLLAQYANLFGTAVGWLRIETPDASPEHLLHRMQSALQSNPPGSASVATGNYPGAHARSLLVIDDLHLIEGSAAES